MTTARSLPAFDLRAIRLQVFRGRKDLSGPQSVSPPVGGFIPFINAPATSPIPAEYEGIAANVSIPLFNGHCFRRGGKPPTSAPWNRPTASRQQQGIAATCGSPTGRDYRVSSRIDVTAHFFGKPRMALDLARGRYGLGLSSIVELTQAELNLTQAEIENLSAKYDYQSQYAVLQYTVGALR